MIGTDDLRRLDLFAGLGDDELHGLVAVAAEVPFVTGEELFREGEPADFWWVLLEGRIDLVRHVGHLETRLGAMDVPGRWAGGFRAWDEHGAYLATGRGSAAGRLLRIPSPALREWSRAWFPFGEHLLEGVFRTARGFEAVTRQKEALVSLGTLAAGLAHEMNNPAAAAVRAADALEDACETLMSSLGRLASCSISADQFVALDALRQAIGPPPAPADPLDVADREEALSSWLAGHGVEREWAVAPTLAAAGVDTAWCERVAGLLPAGALEPGLEWVASTLSTKSLLAELKESTRRVSGLVAGVRSYSQLDRAPVQRIDITEGLESTLVMLGHKIPDGVTVRRDYGDDVPRIEAIAGELNQVWTNLIDNALDAMSGEGTMRVSTRADGDGLVVEIADTGAGMTRETCDHAFEPFFTTKDVGKGTGLGLDLSRRIVVDRHGGEIGIDARPGETVLRVQLPARPPAAKS